MKFKSIILQDVIMEEKHVEDMHYNIFEPKIYYIFKQEAVTHPPQMTNLY